MQISRIHPIITQVSSLLSCLLILSMIASLEWLWLSKIFFEKFEEQPIILEKFSILTYIYICNKPYKLIVDEYRKKTV